MSKLEKKPAYSALVGLLSMFTTRYLLDSAGLPALSHVSLAQGIVYFCVFACFWKLYSVAGWLIALGVSSPLAKPATSAARTRLPGQ